LSTNTSVIHVKGTPIRVPSICVEGRTVITTGKWLKIGSIQDEDLVEGEPVSDPEQFVACLKQSSLGADIFTFIQKLPDTAPKYKYRVEWDNFAVIPITSYADWFEKQADSGSRRAVRKAAKAGLMVKVAEFDDALVRGIVAINNETPFRQGRKFWHFQKSFEDVKRENSTYAERNDFIGAYYNDELIGYIRLTYADKVANIVQILSITQHYDKRPANALIAKAVELCEQKGMQYLLYYNYVYNDPKSSLTEFKRRNGFQKALLPRYYIPLTPKGWVALNLGLHHRLSHYVPKSLIGHLLKLRNQWNARQSASAENL
jgi:hypothetical protein